MDRMKGGLMRWVIRLDVEIEGSERQVGSLVDDLIGKAKAKGASHFRWAFTPAQGFHDPNLEKDLAIGLYQDC